MELVKQVRLVHLNQTTVQSHLNVFTVNSLPGGRHRNVRERFQFPVGFLHSLCGKWEEALGARVRNDCDVPFERVREDALQMNHAGIQTARGTRLRGGCVPVPQDDLKAGFEDTERRY